MIAENSVNNRRIARNTIMLYVRQLVVMAAGFYTARIVLQTLGVEDFGVYNVVGGVVSTLSFMTLTMSSATQRFFSFYLGTNDVERLRRVFSVNLVIYILLLIFIFVVMQSVGVWFVKSHLVIPSGRESAVYFIFQISILTFMVNLISSPFVALINAHEDMQIFAYVSIVEAVMKLAIVYLLSTIEFDKLRLYSLLYFGASALITIIYIVISALRYVECQFRRWYLDYRMFREIVTYTGWTLFGELCSSTRMQGVTILMNQYFSPIVVASRAIAMQATTNLSSFAGNFNRSLYPPIIKSYSSGDLGEMYRLINRGSKISFFLVWVITLPLWIYMDQILTIWLGEVPHRAVLFTRLSLIEVLIQSISYSIMTAARAPGRIKFYEITLGVMQLIFFGVVWYMLSLGFADYSVYVAIIVLGVAMFFARLILVRGLTGLPLRSFVVDVVLRMVGVVVLSLLPFVVVLQLLEYNFWSMLAVMVVGSILNCVVMYGVGLDRGERFAVWSMVKNRIKKFL